MARMQSVVWRNIQIYWLVAHSLALFAVNVFNTIAVKHHNNRLWLKRNLSEDWTVEHECTFRAIHTAMCNKNS
jgi:hypothetical protein